MKELLLCGSASSPSTRASSRRNRLALLRDEVAPLCRSDQRAQPNAKAQLWGLDADVTASDHHQSNRARSSSGSKLKTPDFSRSERASLRI
jgi:hypothetical protein